MVDPILQVARIVAVLVVALERAQGKEQERLGKAILGERLQILDLFMEVAVAVVQVQLVVMVHPTYPEMVGLGYVQL